MPIIIQSAQEAQAALNIFNGFHDAFIQKFCLISHDKFEARGIQTLSGELDLEITFAHYNYRMGEPEPDQLVVAKFSSVMGLEFSISGLSYEWSVNGLHIQHTTRRTELRADEPCFTAILLQNRLNEENEWKLHEDLKFTFLQAEFDEL
jgi:hypothetical protein